MKILVTGAAGFIGYHLVKRLALEKHDVLCIDNINNYYDVELKEGRLTALGFDHAAFSTGVNSLVPSSIFPNACFIKTDLCNAEHIYALFERGRFDAVLHLAAQAGVRYSLTNPDAYISSNIQGFLNVMEAARRHPPRHLVYASSSSVYGLCETQPFSENSSTNHPVSLYAASKKTNELMAHTYSHLYNIPTTGLRFFTIYGPWGRPDMAPFIFTKSILEEKFISVFNNGNMKRDFTYIDDIIEGIVRIVSLAPQKSPKSGGVPAAIYNVGNGNPVELVDFIHVLENALGKKALINYAPMQPGDVTATWADCSALERDTGFHPHTALADGVQQFIAWYKKFYNKG